MYYIYIYIHYIYSLSLYIYYIPRSVCLWEFKCQGSGRKRKAYAQSPIVWGQRTVTQTIEVNAQSSDTHAPGLALRTTAAPTALRAPTPRVPELLPPGLRHRAEGLLPDVLAKGLQPRVQDQERLGWKLDCICDARWQSRPARRATGCKQINTLQ